MTTPRNTTKRVVLTYLQMVEEVERSVGEDQPESIGDVQFGFHFSLIWFVDGHGYNTFLKDDAGEHQLAAVIRTEDSQGFKTYSWFETCPEVATMWEEIEKQDAECYSDEEV